MNDMGGRAYRTHTFAKSFFSIEIPYNEKRLPIESRFLPGPMAGGLPVRKNPFLIDEKRPRPSSDGEETLEKPWFRDEGVKDYTLRKDEEEEDEDRVSDAEGEVGDVSSPRRSSIDKGKEKATESFISLVSSRSSSPMPVEKLRTGSDEGYFGYESSTGQRPFENRIAE
jgi:hypothetical protein